MDSRNGTTRGDDLVPPLTKRGDLTLVRYMGTVWADAPEAVELILSRQVHLYRGRADGRQERQGFDVTIWGAGLQMRSGTSIGEWVYCFEYYRDGVDAYARRFNANGVLTSVEVHGSVADEPFTASMSSLCPLTVRPKLLRFCHCRAGSSGFPTCRT